VPGGLRASHFCKTLNLTLVPKPCSRARHLNKDLKFQIMPTSCHFQPGTSLVPALKKQLVYMTEKGPAHRALSLQAFFG
jgi:hypothetical protein